MVAKCKPRESPTKYSIHFQVQLELNLIIAEEMCSYKNKMLNSHHFCYQY